MAISILTSHISSSRMFVPLAESGVAAGFPSPAEDHLDRMLDLNEYLIHNPASTFLVRVDGESMSGAGIFPGDLLVVDRSVEAGSGDVVVAVIDGDMTLKRLVRSGRRSELRSENPSYPPIRFREGGEVEIWGVVRHVIRSL